MTSSTSVSRLESKLSMQIVHLLRLVFQKRIVFISPIIIIYFMMSSTNSSAIVASKKVLRQEMRSLLRSKEASQIHSESRQVWNRVFENPVYQKARSIGIFLSMTHEIQTRPFLRMCCRDRKQIYVPRVGANFEQPDMEMYRVHYDYEDQDSSSQTYYSDDTTPLFYDTWPTNKWKIPEPPEEIFLQEPPATSLDLVIVPGLAFDTSGNRLGQGKGYYDRFLAKLQSQAEDTSAFPYLLAVGLSGQLLVDREIPHDSYDYRMDSVAVPEQLLVIGKNPGK